MEQKCCHAGLLLTFHQLRSFLLTISLLRIHVWFSYLMHFFILLSQHIIAHPQYLQKLPLVENYIGKLVTDDPSVIESSLAKHGVTVHPDQNSVVHR